MSVNILFIAANPADTQRLGIGEEYKTLREAWLKAGTEAFALHLSLAATVKDLQDELIRIKPQIVHFSGHGEAGALAFAGQQDSTCWAETKALAELFALCAGHVQCVLLNACYSEAIATAVSVHIPTVIGMAREIEDSDAIRFSDGFYSALFGGEDCESAFKHGKVRLDLENRPGCIVPQLKSKSGQARQTLIDSYANDVLLCCAPSLKAQGEALLEILDDQLTQRFGRRNRYRLRSEENAAPDLPALLQDNACTLLLTGAESQIPAQQLSRTDSKRLFWLETVKGKVTDELLFWSYRLWQPGDIGDEPLAPDDMRYRRQLEQLADELHEYLLRLRDEAEQRARLEAEHRRKAQNAAAQPKLNLPELAFFIDATPEDRALLQPMEQLLAIEGAEYSISIEPAYIRSAADVDNDLKSNLSCCDVFLLVYGRPASYPAIRHRLALCRRLERDRGKPLLAIIVHNEPPAPDKPPPGMKFKNLHVFDCPPEAIEEYLPRCLNHQS